MATRPKIPADIERALLVESGHRCAVCGESCPLERAHIIPWNKSREHKLEDLICLCASCHERADHEDWGTQVLRLYKSRPWVLRKQDDRYVLGRKKKVRLTLDLQLGDYDGLQERIIINALAGFLSVSPESIKIDSIDEGSVILDLELPTEAADRILDAYKRRDPEMVQIIERLNILNISEPVPETPRPNKILKLGLRYSEGVVIIDIDGPLTIGRGDIELRQTLSDILKHGHKKIMISMAGLSYMDSSGLGEIISAHTAVERVGGELKPTHTPRDVKEILQITALIKALEEGSRAEEEGESIA